MTTQRTHIMVCGGTGCVSAQSLEIVDKFKAKLDNAGYGEEVAVIRTGCFGFCGQGPIVKIHPDNIFYVQVGLSDVDDIVDEHIIKGRVVERLLYKEPETQLALPKHDEMNFYKKQYRIALRNCGLINPEDINEYIAFNGYEALGKALTEYSPEEVISIVKASGLRGRGDGGFLTGLRSEEHTS